MRAIEPLLQVVNPNFAMDPDLHRIVLNARSCVEANFAVEVLTRSVPDKALAAATNIREVIKELPRCPLMMAVDFDGLARTWNLEREGMGWVRSFEDSSGDYTIVLLGDGNCCYDIVVRAGDRTIMWMPPNAEEDYLNPDIIDLIMETPGVLGSIVSLAEAMGVAIYPTFYLSLKDWRQEHVQVLFDEVGQLFGVRTAAEAEHDRRTALSALEAITAAAPASPAAAARSGRNRRRKKAATH